MLPLCLLALGLSLRGRAADTNVRVSRWFCCCCTRGAVGFIFATTLVFMIGHICIIFAQLPHGLQLSPVIAAESRLRHGIAGQVLVHAVSLAAGCTGGLFVIFWLFWHSRKELSTRSRLCSLSLGQLAVGGILSFPVAGCEGMAQGKEALHAHHEYLSIGIG